MILVIDCQRTLLYTDCLVYETACLYVNVKMWRLVRCHDVTRVCKHARKRTRFSQTCDRHLFMARDTNCYLNYQQSYPSLFYGIKRPPTWFVENRRFIIHMRITFCFNLHRLEVKEMLASQGYRETFTEDEDPCGGVY